MFGCPVPPIDCRPISFEIRRRKVALCNNDAFPIDYDFDLLDVLDSELLNELDPIDPVLKDKIRALSFQERADLKAQILDGNSWMTEFVPPSMACLVCNTAGSFPYKKQNFFIYLIHFWQCIQWVWVRVQNLYLSIVPFILSRYVQSLLYCPLTYQHSLNICLVSFPYIYLLFSELGSSVVYPFFTSECKRAHREISISGIGFWNIGKINNSCFNTNAQ